MITTLAQRKGSLVFFNFRMRPPIYYLQYLGNGEVDFEEFLLMMKKQMMSRDVDSEMREAFRVFDRNGDGQIRWEATVKLIWRHLLSVITVLDVLGVPKTASSYTCLAVSPLDRTMLVIPIINHIPASFLTVCSPLTQAPQIIAKKKTLSYARKETWKGFLLTYRVMGIRCRCALRKFVPNRALDPKPLQRSCVRGSCGPAWVHANRTFCLIFSAANCVRAWINYSVSLKRRLKQTFCNFRIKNLSSLARNLFKRCLFSHRRKCGQFVLYSIRSCSHESCQANQQLTSQELQIKRDEFFILTRS